VTEFLRVDNVGDRNYVGSVIVNETNRRYYEPAPRRNMTVGIQAALTF
jgi:iron complex outermembrane receptor protein